MIKNLKKKIAKIFTFLNKPISVALFLNLTRMDRHCGYVIPWYMGYAYRAWNRDAEYWCIVPFNFIFRWINSFQHYWNVLRSKPTKYDRAIEHTQDALKHWKREVLYNDTVQAYDAAKLELSAKLDTAINIVAFSNENSHVLDSTKDMAILALKKLKHKDLNFFTNKLNVVSKISEINYDRSYYGT